MSEHKYILEPYKGMNTRYRCPAPNCGKDKTFSLYIDIETGKHIHSTVGRCNRESNCGHHYTPKQYFQDNNISFDAPQPIAYKPRPVMPQKPVSFIPVEVFKASLKGYETNHFVKFLINLFWVEVTSELISRYFIGTSKYWEGATVFWQIDTQGKVRTAKIMQYSPITGKRIKVPFNHINWVHKVLKRSEFELKQCFFGSHLLIDKTKPIALVESEKTAIIASVYLPQFIWLAVGSLNNLNAEKCSILKGRSVTLFPDLNGFEKWSNKAKELSHLATFTVSDLLERKATEAERKQGFDIADHLIKFNYKEFLLPENLTKPHIENLIKPDIENLTKLDIEKGLGNRMLANVSIPEVNETKNLIKLNIQNLSKPLVQNLTGSENLVKLSISSLSKLIIKVPVNLKKLETWEQDINELENYFAGITIPTQPVKLNKCSTITNCSLFIERHFATVKANKDKRTFLPYLNRLKELKIKIQLP